MSKRRKNVFLSPPVLIAIIGFLGVVITAYFNYLGNVKPLEITIAETNRALTSTAPTLSSTAPPRSWYVIFSREFPPGHFTEGIHKYLFDADCPFSINSTKENEPSYSFTVRQDVELQNSMVYIRRGGLYLVETFGASYGDMLNPSQATMALYGPLAITFEDAERLRDECKVRIQIDDGEFMDLNPIRIGKVSN